MGLVAGLALLMAVAGCSAGTPVSSPTAGSGGTGRDGASATLLADGRVLFAGGTDGSASEQVVASAEVYNPASGKFGPTGSLTQARTGQTATRLADGRVLIAGGYGVSSSLATAELFDPKADTFTAAGSMTTGRNGHTATLLSDGRVLIVGGLGASDFLSSAEEFDPATGTFTAMSSMAVARSSHTATLMASGKVLIVGGHAGDMNPLDSAELFDPATSTFSDAGRIREGDRHTASALPDGRILVTGGRRCDKGWIPCTDFTLKDTELFDPASGKFAASGPMTASRVDHTATTLRDGRVLIAGGYSEADDTTQVRHILATAELFDPKTGTFAATGDMTGSRSGHSATLLSDGRVLIVGGLLIGGGSTQPGTAEIYDPATGKFNTTG